MNKKKTLILCTVGALIVLLLAVLLISRGCDKQPTIPNGSEESSNTIDTAAGSGNVTDGEVTTEGTGGAEGSSGAAGETLGVSGGLVERPVFTQDDPENTDPKNEQTTGKPTEGTGTTQATQPQSSAATDPESSENTEPFRILTYEEYEKLSGDEQMAYAHRFESTQAYIDWYNAAYAEYLENLDEAVVTGPGIDLSGSNP